MEMVIYKPCIFYFFQFVISHYFLNRLSNCAHDSHVDLSDVSRGSWLHLNTDFQWNCFRGR